MKVKTSVLTGAALDWAVTEALVLPDYGQRDADDGFHPSTDWAQAGPIIERERISVVDEYVSFRAGMTDGAGQCIGVGIGPTHLVAAMRCYVASVLGDEVDIPLDLMVYDHGDE